MTIAEYTKKLMFDLGMFPKQTEEVFNIIMNAPENEVMQCRWNDEMSGYDKGMKNILWMITRKTALDYIDKNCPKAWFRPMFLPQDDLQALFEETVDKKNPWVKLDFNRTPKKEE